MSAAGLAQDTVDFKLLFEESPDVLLVLAPDAPRFTMVGATRARLLATHLTREQTIGRGLFEVFPDNPDDPEASGSRNLRASLERVLATRAADTMAVQKYDIRAPDGTFQVKYWSPKNIPVLSSRGEVRFILHRVEDVTELVRASEIGEALKDRTQAMEREVIRRSQELANAIQELREANTKLGELDTAKTAFFSNVSHEFRTPLTLMLGPLEDALNDTGQPLDTLQRQRVNLAHANALRLLKLVNVLLDFSRLEAGRFQSRFAPADLAKLTRELAGMFQSAVDKAGLRLVLQLAPLSEPAWIDQEMWEKIVLNLLSNAFKYTLAGEITVRLSEQGSRFVLEVADTGVGIPEAELPRVFDRFHRVRGTQGRTHEGTGIGLALVRDLALRHGGSVAVESKLGHGTTVRVELPKGFVHLPPEAVSEAPAERTGGENTRAIVAEAMRWDSARRDIESESAPAPAAGVRATAKVLIVDDNADLRDYISKLLKPTYDVSVVPDGIAALDAIRATPPDIVLSDVMMPRLDGFGLVRELRGNPTTKSLPIILLSARAGEESAVDGLAAGADDYLVKPFSARELLARVRAHVELARARREWLAELERANAELEAFSYSVSHDLRAPLRAIGGMSRALADDCGPALSESCKHYLERIGSGVDKMSALIDALLQLSGVTRAPMSKTRVDLSALAADVFADLQRAQPTRAVRLNVSPGLVASGDPALLRVLLVNLIGNAWKFTVRAEQATIEVGQRPEDASVFFVRDNGAGFDMAYAQKLFTPFQRLHRANEFEGTGIGLATSQRVVTRHGGKIWAEGAVQRGATIFFSLPTLLTTTLVRAPNA